VRERFATKRRPDHGESGTRLSRRSVMDDLIDLEIGEGFVG
jgi:hypothetical protein